MITREACYDPLLDCLEREQLWDEYNGCMVQLGERVDALAHGLAPSAFADRIREAYEAHLSCRKARASWERHIQEHGCLRLARQDESVSS